MNNINISLIKELRLRTGAGFMECKRALIEENGNIEQSIDNLRKSGQSYAEKKIYHTTNQGSIFLDVHNNNIGAMLELNCQTDFVAKDDLFIALGNEIIATALLNKIKDIDNINHVFEHKKTELISKIKENVKINRFFLMEGGNIISYLHRDRIGVLINAHNIKQSILKKIAMHIAASKPQYLSPNEVPNDIFKREYEIQIEVAKKHNKSDNILKKIVQGRMNKFVNSISLTGQNFIMDNSKTVGQIISDNNGHIISFKRFEIGENISN